MAKTAVAGYDKQLVEIAMGYQRSRALCAAARLGIADALGESERSAADLAGACKADVAALHRLLRALASIGIVTETRPGSFVLTEFGKPLRKDVPDSAWPAVIFWADLLANNWSSLTECVRTGKNAATLRPEIMVKWQQDPEGPAIFRAVMGTSPAEAYMPIARAWNFSTARVVADLGGGGGALIAAILEAFPNTTGMLVDRTESIEAARPRFSTGPLAQRTQLVAADLTQEVPRGADVYILKHVLHGYTDEATTDILRSCRAVTPPDGRVLIVEFVLPDVIDRVDRDLESRLMSDLNMLEVTAGKERSALEWNNLIDKADLRYERIIPVADDLVSIVEARV
jgi:ubiquinone/menaquinone biosynthesis C-methylase UbiE